MPTVSILSSSTWTFSLYFEFKRKGLYLTGFASSFNVIFITPKSQTIPLKSVNLVGNKP